MSHNQKQKQKAIPDKIAVVAHKGLEIWTSLDKLKVDKMTNTPMVCPLEKLFAILITAEDIPDDLNVVDFNVPRATDFNNFKIVLKDVELMFVSERIAMNYFKLFMKMKGCEYVVIDERPEYAM